MSQSTIHKTLSSGTAEVRVVSAPGGMRRAELELSGLRGGKFVCDSNDKMRMRALLDRAIRDLRALRGQVG